MTADALVQLRLPRGGDIPARDGKVPLRTLQDRRTGKLGAAYCMLHQMPNGHHRVQSSLDPGTTRRRSRQP
ncbi:hypothetical protein AB0K86_19995 [Streptomyces clavifer]|uniref:hypothetical protein n=1 Tax=Streptomyces clavifer TaxID=68188 RepID=UPI00342ECBA3